MILKKLAQIFKAVAYPFARLYDLVHNGQSDIEGVYPESFHPTGEQASVATSMNTQMR
jgi:hypothetical protein